MKFLAACARPAAAASVAVCLVRIHRTLPAARTDLSAVVLETHSPHPICS